jgi:hypothetical protein
MAWQELRASAAVVAWKATPSLSRESADGPDQFPQDLTLAPLPALCRPDAASTQRALLTLSGGLRNPA